MFLKHVQKSKKIRFSNLMRIQKNIKLLKILKKEQKKISIVHSKKQTKPTNKQKFPSQGRSVCFSSCITKSLVKMFYIIDHLFACFYFIVANKA